MTWMPIETAPKDGTIVDLFIDGGRLADCKFLDGAWHYWTEYGEYQYDPDYRRIDWKHEATHWMPLPEPPCQTK